MVKKVYFYSSSFQNRTFVPLKVTVFPTMFYDSLGGSPLTRGQEEITGCDSHESARGGISGLWRPDGGAGMSHRYALAPTPPPGCTRLPRFQSVFLYLQGVPKKALQFLSIRAQSRCDPDPDHISIGPGLTETVTLFWDTLYLPGG